MQIVRKILKIWSKLSQQVSQLQGCPLKNCVLVCKVNTHPGSTQYQILSEDLSTPHIHVPAKYQHYTLRGFIFANGLKNFARTGILRNIFKNDFAFDQKLLQVLKNYKYINNLYMNWWGLIHESVKSITLLI